MFIRYSLATLVAMLALVVPAQAWEVRVTVVGSGSIDETTPADKLNAANCSTSQNTPNGTTGKVCIAGTPSGEYGQGWTVRYVATPSSGWEFRRWESDGEDTSTRDPIKCDGATGFTYTGTACQFGTYNNYQTRAVFEDVTAPVPSITGGPADGTTTGRSTSFGFTATNNPGQTTSYSCRLTRGTTVVENWTACSSGKGYSSLESGGHKFEVRATDPSGLTNLTERNWNVDGTAPETTLQADGPAQNSLTKSRTATFQFSAGADATKYHCRIDKGTAAGAVGSCTSPYTTPQLADGTYTFRVWAEDAVGNVESSHATRTWTIDATAPETTVTGGPAEGGSTQATSATFGLEASEAGVTYRCSLDGAVATECASPHTVSSLALGRHTLSVHAIDAAGNPDPEPATRTWTVVDETAPDTTLSGGPVEGASTTDTTATFGFASTEAGGFRCSLDGAAPADCTTPYALSGLSAGTHTLKVWARDAAGNEDPTPATRTWTVLAGGGGTGGGGGGGTGTGTGTGTGDGGGGTVVAPAQVGGRLGWGHVAKRRYTTLSKLTLTALSSGSAVKVRCRGKRCPVKTFARTGGGTLKLKKFLRRKLPVGTTIEITVTKAGYVGKRFTVTIRAGKGPLVKTACLDPGVSRPRAC